MSKSNLLRQAKADIAAGQLGMARQRLHTLVQLFPDDLSLRRCLGDVYGKLQYPERAGCYWYLEEKKTPEMEVACEKFEKACGRKPYSILRALKLKGGPDSLPLGYARTLLEELSKHAPDYRFPIHKPQPQPVDTSRFGETVLKYGCLILLVAMGAIFSVGLLTVYREATQLFRDFMR